MNVNPPPLKVPTAFRKDTEVYGAYSALLTVIRQLWARTGGTDDAIEGNITFTSQADGTNSILLQRIDELERRIALMSSQLNRYEVLIDEMAHFARPPIISEDAIKLAIVKHG